MPDTVTVENLLQLLSEYEIVADADGLEPESDLFAAGLDSMALMQLLLQLEQVFGLQLEPAEITRDRFRTATSLADYLHHRSAAH